MFGLKSTLIKNRNANCFSAFRIPAARALTAINLGKLKIPDDIENGNKYFVYEMCGGDFILRAAQPSAKVANEYLTSDNHFVFYYE